MVPCVDTHAPSAEWARGYVPARQKAQGGRRERPSDPRRPSLLRKTRRWGCCAWCAEQGLEFETVVLADDFLELMDIPWSSSGQALRPAWESKAAIEEVNLSSGSPPRLRRTRGDGRLREQIARAAGVEGVVVGDVTRGVQDAPHARVCRGKERRRCGRRGWSALATRGRIAPSTSPVSWGRRKRFEFCSIYCVGSSFTSLYSIFVVFDFLRFLPHFSLCYVEFHLYSCLSYCILFHHYSCNFIRCHRTFASCFSQYSVLLCLIGASFSITVLCCIAGYILIFFPFDPLSFMFHCNAPSFHRYFISSCFQSNAITRYRLYFHFVFSFQFIFSCSSFIL